MLILRTWLPLVDCYYGTTVYWRPEAREPSCFVMSAFRLSANYRRTVPQVDCIVTCGRFARVEKAIFV